MALIRAVTLLLLAGCARSPVTAVPPVGFEREFATALEKLRSSAAYSARYEILLPGHRVKGMTKRYRGEVLRIVRDVGGSTTRHVEVGDRAWWLPGGASSWAMAPSTLRGTLEDPETVLRPLANSTPRWLRDETVDGRDCRVLELDIDLPLSSRCVARVWVRSGSGLWGLEIAAPRLKLTMQIGDVRLAPPLEPDGDTAPWSEEMKAAVSRALSGQE